MGLVTVLQAILIIIAIHRVDDRITAKICGELD